MKVLVDTNVVLDLLLDRVPHAEHAARIFSMIERDLLTGYLCATTLTTVHYLATKTVGGKKLLQEIRTLLRLFDVAPVNRTVLEAALEAKGFTNFEDAGLHEAARQVGADALVTRNEKDFKKAKLAVYGPGDLISAVAAQQEKSETSD